MDIRKFNLQSDSPDENDSFDDSHSKIAKTIIDLINTNEKSCTMGIEGAWGSGKSTVIKIIQKNIEKNENLKIINFDAWAHEGDPLRRVFLERITEKLCSFNWVDKNKWTEKQKRLIGKVSKSKTHNIPYISKSGIIILISTFFVPIGINNIREAISRGHVLFNSEYEFSRLLCSGIIFSFFPIIAGLVLYGGNLLWNLIKGNRKTNDDGIESCQKKNENSDVAGNIFTMLVRKIQTETEITTSESPNPTSVEFEDYFILLMKEAFQNIDRKLIIALDNLDRVLINDGLELISTLQPFMLRSEIGFDRLWFLLPYDRDGLASLWSGENSSKQTNKELGSVSKSMMEKIIQINVPIPKLVLSGWQNFLSDKLEYSFEGIKEEEKEEVFRIFYWYMKDENILPTPRVIKRYINDLIAILAQWKDEYIPIGYAALFVLLKGEPKFLESIKSGFSQLWINEYYDQQELSKYLAMLWFNTKSTIAMQLLIEEDLEHTILNRDNEKFSHLLNDYGKYAVIALHKMIFEKSLTVKEFSRFGLNSCYMLEQQKQVRELLSTHVIDLTNRISKELKKKELPSLDSETTSGLCSLIGLKGDKIFSRQIFERIVSQDVFRDIGDTAQLSITDQIDISKNWFTNLLSVYNRVSDLSHDDIFNKPVPSSQKPIVILIVYQMILEMEENYKVPLFLSFITDNQEIGDFLVLALTDTNLVHSLEIALPLIFNHHPSMNFQPMVDQIGELLNNQSYDLIGPEYSILCSLFLTYPDLNLSKIIDLIRKGNLYHHFFDSKSKHEISDHHIATFLFLTLQFIENVINPNPVIGLSSQGFQMFVEILNTINKDDPIIIELLQLIDDEKFLIKCLENYNKIQKIENLICAIFNRKNISLIQSKKLINLDVFISYDKNLINILPENDLVPIIKVVDEDNSLINHYISTEYDPEKGKVYLNLLIATENNLALFKWIQEHFNNLESSDWKTILQEESAEFIFVCELAENNVSLSLEMTYENSLFEVAKLIVSGSFIPIHPTENWNLLSNHLEKKTFYPLIQENLLALLENTCLTETTQSPTLLKYFGSVLSEIRITQRNNASIVGRILTKLIELEDESTLNWCKIVVEKNVDYLCRSTAKAIKGFKNQLSTLQTKSTSEAEYIITQIKTLLKVS